MEKPKIWPPPHHAQTPNVGIIKISRGDYVVDPYTCAKVRHDSPRGYLSAHAFRARVTLRAKLHTQKVLVFFGFLQLATAKAPGRILTQNTPKLVVLRKDVPFRGRKHKI